jgi:hypothetical protein
VLIVGARDTGTATVTKILQDEFGAELVGRDRTALLPAISPDWIAVRLPLSCVDCGDFAAGPPEPRALRASRLPAARITQVVLLGREPETPVLGLADDVSATDWLDLRRHLLAVPGPANDGGWWQRLVAQLPVRRMLWRIPSDLPDLAKAIANERPS